MQIPCRLIYSTETLNTESRSMCLHIKIANRSIKTRVYMYQGLANYSLQTKSHRQPNFINKVLRAQPHSFTYCLWLLFVLHQQCAAVGIEKVWFPKPKIFTMWRFEQACSLLIYLVEYASFECVISGCKKQVTKFYIADDFTCVKRKNPTKKIT